MSVKLKEKEFCSVSVVVTKDCYKTLKKISVDKECNTSQIAKEILEKVCGNKKKNNVIDLQVLDE